MQTAKVTKNSWEEAYLLVLGNKKAYQKRLNELLEWDRPLCKEGEDPGGKWPEYRQKIAALKMLLQTK